MKQINQYIFNLYHFILNVRDTMEYSIERDHDVKIYENRQKVLTEELKEGHAFGNFLINNGENGEKLKARMQEFIDDFYVAGNNVLTVAGDKVRVDHTQNIKIFTGVGDVSNTLRDILSQYMGVARNQKDDEEVLTKLVVADERMYRVVFNMLVMREFQKSFAEFQKAMAENKGQPSPQSNFIVQNELFIMAKLLRDCRANVKVTDNETLDLLDEVIQVVEMTEGRRDRRNNKTFKDLFDDLNRKLGDAVNKAEPVWKQAYEAAVQEMIRDQQAAAPAPEQA